MAFDQMSLFLYPPRWKSQRIGAPITIVSDVRVDDSIEQAIKADDVHCWLEGKSFKIDTRSSDFVVFKSSTRLQSESGLCPEIEVHVGAKAGEFTSLHCLFLLTRDTPTHLEAWQAFIEELCGNFALRISVSDTDFLGPEGFLIAVHQDYNWRYSAKPFGWESPPD